jgi:hypothetical protein
MGHHGLLQGQLYLTTHGAGSSKASADNSGCFTATQETEDCLGQWHGVLELWYGEGFM